MICPICLKDGAIDYIEKHTDSLSGQTYKIYRCSECEVISSEPMRLPSLDWYHQAFPFKEVENDLKLRWEYKIFLKEKIQHSGKLLDIGCGSGNFLLLAQRAGYQVTGLDFDARQIEKARSLGLTDVEQISFDDFYAKRKNEKFNVIILFGILEHVEAPNIFIKKIKEMLCADGKIAIVLPNDDRPLTFVREIHDYPPHHFTRWTRRSLVKFLENNGFRIITIHDSAFPLHHIKVNIYSLIIKTFFGQLYNSFSRVENDKKRIFLAKYYRVIKKTYLVCITPFALLFWLIFKIGKADCGSDIYALSQLGSVRTPGLKS